MPNENNSDTRSTVPESIKLERDIRSGEKWLIGITGTALIVSVIIAFIYYGQLIQMRKATSTTKEALTSVQRAFVSFTGAGGAEKTIVGNKITTLTISLPWVNAGTTPTPNAIGIVNWEPFIDGLPANFGFPDNGNVQNRQFSIAPKGVANATETIPIEVFDAARQGKVHLFVWGWITYHDIFDGTPTRLGEFCDEITNIKSSVNNISDPSTTITWQLSLCTVPHNCSDEECSDYEQKSKGR